MFPLASLLPRPALWVSGNTFSPASFYLLVRPLSFKKPKRGTVACLRLGFLGNSPWNGALWARIWLGSAGVEGRQPTPAEGEERRMGRGRIVAQSPKTLPLVLTAWELWGWDGPLATSC